MILGTGKCEVLSWSLKAVDRVSGVVGVGQVLFSDNGCLVADRFTVAF